MDTTLTLISGSPLDDRGRLVHEDDPAAQLALAIARLEAALAATGHRNADLTGLRMLTTDRAAMAGVTDVLTERLAATGADTNVDVVEVAALAVPGQLVALETVLDLHSPTTPSTTHTKTIHSKGMS